MLSIKSISLCLYTLIPLSVYHIPNNCFLNPNNIFFIPFYIKNINSNVEAKLFFQTRIQGDPNAKPIIKTRNNGSD